MFELIMTVIIAGCFYFIGSLAGDDDAQRAIWNDCLTDKKFVIHNTAFECKAIAGSWNGHPVEFTK